MSLSMNQFLDLAKVRRISGEKSLSNTSRGYVRVVQDIDSNDRCVLRLSPMSTKCTTEAKFLSTKDLARMETPSARIYRFSMAVEKDKTKFPGISPSVARPVILQHNNHRFLVQKFRELTLNGNRMDLFTFLVEKPDFIGSNRTLGYVYNVCEALHHMHKKEFAHLDVSLENVCLADDRAYLIDFESVLPTKDIRGFIQKKDLHVPVKHTFVPPEHFACKRNDYVNLKSYDVWALGSMLFTAAFGVTLFAVESTKDGYTTVCLDEVGYFLKFGFPSFLNQFHPDLFEKLFRKKSSDELLLLGDLLVRTLGTPELVRQSHDVFLWMTNNRLSMEGIYEHPFWEAVKSEKL